MCDNHIKIINDTVKLLDKKDEQIKRLTDSLNECNLDRMHESGKLNRALDEIQGILSGQIWDMDTCGQIVDVIMSTGREILDVDENDNNNDVCEECKENDRYMNSSYCYDCWLDVDDNGDPICRECGYHVRDNGDCEYCLTGK